MSFGFLTESALLPAKSKPIKVDSRSLVDLKAVVYEKEQKVKVGGGGGSGSGDLRALRGKRAASGDERGSGRKDPFAKTNRGVEDRSQRDELERVTASSKKKAAERSMAAKSSLYKKMARGEVDSSHAESLVDFSRKTGADLALLESNTDKRGRGRSMSAKRQRSGEEAESDDGMDIDGTEVTIVDEFGRDRCVARGGPEHRTFLEAMKAAAEKEAQERAESESYDGRYSYRGNKGVAAAAGAAPAATAVGQWAWSSGTGRGVDEGDFETRERQELRGKKKMKKLLEQEGNLEGAKEGSGAKILSQWEKTLKGKQKSFLDEVHKETEANRSKTHTDRNKQRTDRKELLRRKQEARAARSRGDA